MEWLVSAIERLPNLEALSTRLRLASALVRRAYECIQFQMFFGVDGRTSPLSKRARLRLASALVGPACECIQFQMFFGVDGRTSPRSKRTQKRDGRQLSFQRTSENPIAPGIKCQDRKTYPSLPG